MAGRDSRRVSISLADRGQTTQDFAVGIGVFLLAIAFVFGSVPTFLTPFSSSDGPAKTAQADRIASIVVEDLSTGPDEPNNLSDPAFQAEYSGADSAELANDLGLRESDGVALDRINITIETFNQSESLGNRTIHGAGDEYSRSQSAASAARIVTIDDDENRCEPACRLVVRVW